MEHGPTPEQIKRRDRTEARINSIGSQMHEEWRAPRLIGEVGDSKRYKPRPKPTTDLIWSQAHDGTRSVDIANTSYPDLPKDAQEENRASAEVAVHEVEKAIDADIPLDEAFIESASSTLHDKWMERRIALGYSQAKLDLLKEKTDKTEDEHFYFDRWSYDEKNMVPYMSLSEEEKEKDRVVIRKAIVVCNKKE